MAGKEELMPDAEPKISVVMPIYNTNPGHLRESVSSILGQTFTDFEFLILNDSPDNTELDAIISSFRDSRIRYVRNEYNMGISAARNKLLDMARGEYVAVMDHDDISLPERFAKEVAYLDSHPDVGVCSCWADIFPGGGELHHPEESIEIKKHLMEWCVLLHPAAMIRREVLEQHHLRYEAEYSPSEDHRLWLRMMEFSAFYNIPETLFHYRMHSENTTSHQRQQMTKATEMLQCWARIKYPEWYAAYRRDGREALHIKLFKVIPLLKIVRTYKRTSIFLFNRIPLLNYREGGGHG